MENSTTPALNQDARVYAGQVELLYSHAPIGIAASILNGTIIVIVLWMFIPHVLLIFWGGLLLSVSIIRIVDVFRYWKAGDRQSGARKWGRRFLVGLGCSGIIWGSSAIWFFHADKMELHVLIAFAIGGMIAGASATLSALQAVYYAFAVPSALPLVVAFFVHADMIHVSMGCMLLIFVIFLSIVAYSIHQIIRYSFQSRFEKDDLILSLQVSRQEAKSAFETLRQEVHKRRDAEQELRALSANLERDVDLRTRELEHANRELNAFAYSVSHDLRAPVRAIDGFSRMLEQEFGELLDDEGSRYLDRIRRSADRMNELIDDILALSRVSRQELKFCDCDLSGIAREIAETLRKEEPGRRADFSIQEGLTGRCDDRLIRIVFENLLSNAWKFTRNAQYTRIEFGAHENTGRTVFFVRDNGVGFDMAYANKLFIPFQRLHPEAEFEGTGIGLATVQRIVHRHGGTIWAKAEVGKGATFFFTLEENTRA